MPDPIETTEHPEGEKPEEKPTETPAETPESEVDVPPDVLRQKLTRANAEAANYRTRLRDVEKRLSEAKTPEEVEQAVADLKEANAKLERELLVERAARRHGLPDDLAGRLKGSTLEELEADAKELAKYASSSGPESLSGGLDPSDEDAFDPVQVARDARRSRY